ncbi:MAG TPA: hypothetical protein VG147_02030 [Solirubrobacteraceae bacterium]|jgi:site-specific DNA-methyltransferase (cytosine-N4-specific)|nr:hypothetical protein [Solirubrobacteraceae bacterium]
MLAINPPPWRLQEFERDLAIEEIGTLACRAARWDHDKIVVDGAVPTRAIQKLQHRLALASEIVTPQGARLPTTQHLLEQAAGAGGRKTTSYALHSLHPYKGKFYPQLARALLNACGVAERAKVLDPFAGCGTTVLEAGLLGMRGIGVDANPLAVLVAQTKLRVLRREPDELRAALKRLVRLPSREHPLPDASYLERWVPEQNLRYLRRLRTGIANIGDADARDLALVCLSSVLRLGSYQEPAQLRVLRRPLGADVPNLGELFRNALEGTLRAVEGARTVGAVNWSRFAMAPTRMIAGDSRSLLSSLRHHRRGSFDAVITSPPYANALPYIDTDRLSLRALGMLSDGGQQGAEKLQIGNREVPDREIRRLDVEVARELRHGHLPKALRDLLIQAYRVTREPTSGFRKRRTPALLFSYFRDMKSVLHQVAALLRPGAPAVFIVGDSSIAGPGGSTLRVPTGALLTELAAGAGLELTATLDKRLTSYGASSTVHQRNAMPGERVLIFRRAEAAHTQPNLR